MQPKSDSTGWFGQALAVVAAVTGLRLILLAFNRTDLFVDESQYWLWGQELALGYYSKPPLIGWVIRAATEVFGSDAPFFVRLPGAVFHAATALILAAAAASLAGRGAAVWVAASYVTLPFVAVGSLLISTDTIMAPFFAAAVFFYLRLLSRARLADALLAGAMAGLAFLAKYAGVYFLLGAALAALVSPAARIRPALAAALLTAFAVMISPNLLWNLSHDFVTLSHTADNVGWVRQPAPFAGLNPAGLAEFFLSQFAVFGPVLFAALLWRSIRPETADTRFLLAFVLPVLIVVCIQALLSRAYANWAVAAYFAATLVVVPALLDRAPRLLWASVLVNGVICLALPLLTVAPTLTLGRDEPLLSRYLGRADLSDQILAAATEAGGVPVLSAKRDVLADLFHRAAGTDTAIHAPRPAGRPAHYYEQVHAAPETLSGPILWVAAEAPVCDGATMEPFRTFRLEGGAYAGSGLAAYLIEAECLRDAD